jgi:HEAT repeat protein
VRLNRIFRALTCVLVWMTVGAPLVTGQTSAAPQSEASAAANARREAAAREIEALLVKGDVAAALDRYERQAGAVGSGDVGLLAPIARAVLTELSKSDAAEIRDAALLKLARHGDAAARRAIAGLVAEGDPSALGALASQGDRAAVARLEGFVTGSAIPGQRHAAVEALGQAGSSRSAGVLRKALADSDPLLRVTAAEAIGTLHVEAAIPDLVANLDHEMLLVRVSAAVALKRLGDGTGDAILQEALQSPLPDVRIMAAKAWADSGDTSWVGAILPVLQADGLTRLHAAELLLDQDPAGAQAVLAEALADKNPVTRDEAARILARRGDLGALARLLGDPIPWARLHAADTILVRAARKPTTRRGSAS